MEDAKTPGKEKYEYLACDGGPHIILPMAVSAKWKGHKIIMTNPLDPSTDYGRACAVTGDWGVISVAGSNALVLSDPPMSAFKPDYNESPVDIYVLYAWSSIDLDELLDRCRLTRCRLTTRAPSSCLPETSPVIQFTANCIFPSGQGPIQFSPLFIKGLA